MPRQLVEKITNCYGGRSWGCKHDPHPKGQIAELHCYRCSAHLGCSHCVEHDTELICLDCHNWATKAAVAKHGDIVPNAKVYRVRTDNGWIKWNKTGDIPAQVDALLKNPPF